MSLTALAFLAAFSFALLAALLRHPIYGLYAYVAAFYLHPIERWWGRDLPDLRWSLLAAAVTFVALVRLPKDDSRPSWTSSGAAKILIAFTVWLWVQNLWALSPGDQWMLTILYTKYLVLFYLMHRLLDSELSLSRFALAHVIGCLYLGWLVWQAPPQGRLDGIGGPGIDEANALGMHVSTGLAFAAVLLMRGPWSYRLPAIACIPLIMNTMIQTQSRGAFLGLLAGGLVLMYLSPGRYRKYWVLFGAVGVVIMIRMTPDMYWERLSTILAPVEESAEVDQSTSTRLALISAQWEMFKDYPVGTGHRGTATLSPRYLGAEHLTRSRVEEGAAARSSHNTFMTALTEHGIPGAMVYVALLLWVARQCRLIKKTVPPPDLPGARQYMSAAGAALAVVFAAGMFTDYIKVEVQIWCIVLLAILAQKVRALEAEPAPAGAEPSMPARHPVMSPGDPR